MTPAASSVPPDDPFAESIAQQAIVAAEQADAIIVLVDAATGRLDGDEEIARRLQRATQPVFLVVNKMDNPADDQPIHDFWALGLGDPWPVSATHGHGTGDMLDALVAALPDSEPAEEIDAIDVAIIGRPNAGKSSLFNRLTGTERAIVSEVAGTTRDALDVLIEREDTSYRLVDTAGIRRKAQIDRAGRVLRVRAGDEGHR